MSQEFDVIINGGGPVGMGLAIDLGQRGIRTAVVERYRQPQPVPKGQNLTQRTAEHCRAWGCEAELRTAHPIPRGAGIGGLTTYGTLLSDYSYDWLNRESVADYYFAANARLPQYATEAVLRRRAAQIDAIQVFYGLEGTCLAQDAESVRLGIADRDGKNAETLSARYLVGADGSHSFVREAAGIPQTRSDHDRRMVLAVFTSPDLHARLERYPGKAYYCVLHPDYEGYWLFFGRVDHGKSFFFHAPVPLETTKDNFDFKAFIHSAVGAPVDLSIDYLGFWDLRVAIADTYRKGRVFIAGDAAHSHPPYGGYGVNMGLEDARNLAWKLAAAVAGRGGELLLDSYDAERRPVFASLASGFIERYIAEDRAFLETYSPADDPAQFERMWRSRNLDDAEVNAFEPNYEGSPLCPHPGARPSARGTHQKAARTGHHLSPAPLSDGRDLFDALGQDFALIDTTVEGEGTAFEDAARRQGLRLARIADPGGPAAAVYGQPMVLVRPDHYVAWAGSDGNAEAILATAAGLALELT